MYYNLIKINKIIFLLFYIIFLLLIFLQGNIYLTSNYHYRYTIKK